MLRRHGLALGRTATFGDKDVGNGKTVTLTGAALTGADAGNYSADLGRHDARPTSRAKPITGSFTADDKVYDGNTRRRC